MHTHIDTNNTGGHARPDRPAAYVCVTDKVLASCMHTNTDDIHMHMFSCVHTS